MARVIQEHIKKPLADEVLFGQLKGGGHVRVVLVKDEASAEPKDKIGFEFVEGPVTPKPEKLPGARKRNARASRNRAARMAAAPRGRHRGARWSRSEQQFDRNNKRPASTAGLFLWRDRTLARDSAVVEQFLDAALKLTLLDFALAQPFIEIGDGLGSIVR